MLKRILAFILMLSAAMAMAAVDVNKATDAELDGVKGIGPVTSKLIISERKKGEFKSWQDFIDRVKGVGDARAAKLSAEGLTVNGAAYTATTAKKDTKADAKTDAKADKAAAKEDKKSAKTAAKEDSKEAKAVAKDEKKEARASAAEKKDTKATTTAEAKSDSPKPAASSAKAAASAKK